MAKRPQQFVVVGAGRFGSSVAITLSRKGCEVTVIDRNKETIQRISDLVTQAVTMDAADEKALHALGIETADVAIVSIGEEMQASILVTMVLKEMGIKRVIAKAVSEPHGKILARVGADKIVHPEREMGQKIAASLVAPTLLDRIEVAPGYTIAEIEAPRATINKTLADAKIRQKYGITVIAIKKRRPRLDEAGESRLEEEIDISPAADTTIGKGDTLLLIGHERDIAAFRDTK